MCVCMCMRGCVGFRSDGRGFDANLDAKALPGESDVQFRALITMWKKIEVRAASSPGVPLRSTPPAI